MKRLGNGFELEGQNIFYFFDSIEVIKMTKEHGR